MKSSVIVLLLWGLLLKITLCDKDCDDVMKKENVIGKYADSIGSTDLVVCYDIAHIICGEEFAPALLEKKPSIRINLGNSCRYATIAFFGKSPDTEKLTLLWLVYNVEAESLKQGFRGQSGSERVIYAKPKTAQGTSAHFFFVYCQDKYLNLFNCCTYGDKTDFQPMDFAKKNNLTEVTAAVYFKVTAFGEVIESFNRQQMKRNVCPRQQ